MTYRVIVLPQAELDLRKILSWVGERSPEGAGRLLDAFERRLEDLAIRPQSFGFAPEGDLVEEEIRHFFFKTRRGNVYRGLFRIRESTVEVLHVRGPGQDLVAPNG